MVPDLILGKKFLSLQDSTFQINGQCGLVLICGPHLTIDTGKYKNPVQCFLVKVYNLWNSGHHERTMAASKDKTFTKTGFYLRVNLLIGAITYESPING